jgi:hypothetical protein
MVGVRIGARTGARAIVLNFDADCQYARAMSRIWAARVGTNLEAMSPRTSPAKQAAATASHMVHGSPGTSSGPSHDGALPPSSGSGRITRSDAMAMICRPTPVEPVKLTALTAVTDQGGGDVPGGTMDEIDNAGREPGVVEDLEKAGRRERGLLRDAAHHGAAGGEHGGEFPRLDGYRKIPGVRLRVTPMGLRRLR